MFTHPFSLWNCSSVCVYSRPAGRCLGTHIFPLDTWPYGTTHKTCPKYWVSLGILSPCSPSLSPTHPCWDRPRVPLSQIQCSWPSNPEPLAFRVKVGRGGPSRVHEWHPPAGLFPCPFCLNFLLLCWKKAPLSEAPLCSYINQLAYLLYPEVEPKKKKKKPSKLLNLSKCLA